MAMNWNIPKPAQENGKISSNFWRQPYFLENMEEDIQYVHQKFQPSWSNPDLIFFKLCEPYLYDVFWKSLK